MFNPLKSYVLPLMAVPSVVIPHAAVRPVQSEAAEVRAYGSAVSSFGSNLDLRIARIKIVRPVPDGEYFENLVISARPLTARRVIGAISGRGKRKPSLTESPQELARLVETPRVL